MNNMGCKNLKQDILSKVKEYYSLCHKDEQIQFIEGKTKINYAGRIFNEKELEYLIDSSLDFWLTYGKYSEKFEKELAKFLGVRWAFWSILAHLQIYWLFML